MKAFVYRAALLCESCGNDTRAAIAAIPMPHKQRVPVDPNDESSYDSDDYPKGPYDNGGGEADSPQHCDQCGVFLCNPLTEDGRNYVLENLNQLTEPPKQTAKEWVKFYDVWPYTVDGRIQWKFV